MITPTTPATKRRLSFSLTLEISGLIEMDGPAIRDSLMEAIKDYDAQDRLFPGSEVDHPDRLHEIGMGLEGEMAFIEPRRFDPDEAANDDPDELFDHVVDLSLRVDEAAEYLRRLPAKTRKALRATRPSKRMRRLLDL